MVALKRIVGSLLFIGLLGYFGYLLEKPKQEFKKSCEARGGVYREPIHEKHFCQFNAKRVLTVSTNML